MDTFWQLLYVISFYYTKSEWIDTEWIEVPYMVSLRKWEQHFCGGSILSKSNNNSKGVILTAAHCMLWGIDIEIAIGCTHTSFTCEQYDNPSIYSVESYIIHENFNSDPN